MSKRNQFPEDTAADGSPVYDRKAFKVTPPTPSKLAQEVADEIMLTCITGEAEFNNEKAARIISEAIAPLERERDDVKVIHMRFLKQVKKAGIAVDLYDLAFETPLKNERAERAKASLSSLSLAVEQILQALEEPLTRTNIGDWVDDVRDAAERARSLVVK